MKYCKQCNQIKNLNEFHKDKQRKDGLYCYCKDCQNKKIKENYNKNSGKKKLYQELNKDKIINYSKQYRTKYPEMHQNYIKENREKICQIQLKYQKNHSAKINAYSMKRKTIKLQRTPKWLTKEQFKEIESWYILAKELQWLSDPTDPFEVDHIIPLKGKIVSGLHVPWNLQILTKNINIKKSNKIPELF